MPRMHRMSLRDKVVFITGPARGIGAAVSRIAAERGAHLVLVGRKSEPLRTLADELGDRHLVAHADVTDQAALDLAVETARDRFGRIDVVIANAGISDQGTFAVEPVEVIVRTVETNLIGTIRTVKATLPSVLESRGHYLLVGSASAFVSLPGMGTYSATKAGIEMFGNGLRMETAHKGVTVTNAHPSWINTDLVTDTQEDISAFNRIILRLPPPLGTVTDVDVCARRLVTAVEKRQRRMFVPRSMGLVQLIRSQMTGRIGEIVTAPFARRVVPGLEAEITTSGRYFGRHANPGDRSDAER
jgi:short-subunit dehydrogenase